MKSYELPGQRFLFVLKLQPRTASVSITLLFAFLLVLQLMHTYRLTLVFSKNNEFMLFMIKNKINSRGLGLTNQSSGEAFQ